MTESEPARRLAEILRRIEEAAVRADRDAREVTLLGAAKRQPLEVVRRLVEAGLTDIGENRVQEARERRVQLPDHLRWHLIGPLQSNKVNLAVELFDVIHSVDRLKIARLLDRRAAQVDRTLPVFLEVNLGGEESKHGFSPEALADVLDQARDWNRLSVLGLMAIPPPGSDPETSRPWFRRLRQLRDELLAPLRPEGAPGALSMGMSGDFEIAVEEGATHVRIGTSLFGPRP